MTAELTRRNPGFSDPLHVQKDGNGRVWQASVLTTQLEDLSPFRGFPSLSNLSVSGKDESNRGRVWDLSCLKGLNLAGLFLDNNKVRDVSPLQEMPLTFLSLACNLVYDLSPLQNMKLQEIGLNVTNVDDISSLRGMPLEKVYLHNTGIKDLSPLSKAPLKLISASAPELEPLRDLPLEYVNLIGDYKPEQIKMLLRIPTLKELELFGKYDPEQLKEFRGNTILTRIDDKPAAESWKAVDKTEAEKTGKASVGPKE